MSKPFFLPTSKIKSPKTVEGVDVAARHLIYKLYEATNGTAGAWHALGQIGERPATVARALDLGWIVVRDHEMGRKKTLSACLTDDGRRRARKGLQ
jgi:hypothetical protein